MLAHNDVNFQSDYGLQAVARQLKIEKWLKASNFSKNKGTPVVSLIMSLVSIVFYSKNLFQYLNSKWGCDTESKNTYYRVLTNPFYNWLAFLLHLSSFFVSKLTTLTDIKRAKTLILDDSAIPKNRSKHMELLSRAHDHVNNTFYKGFTCLTLGWSDGYSFVPLGFNMLSSANKKNLINPCSETVDKRTNSYKIRKLSQMHKPDAAYLMVKNALAHGVVADFILMDSWFTTEPLITKLCEEGLEVIGMLKNCNYQYWYNGNRYKLNQLWSFVSHKAGAEIYGSLTVHTLHNKIPLKLVFVKNRSKRSEFLCIASTKTTLSGNEIIRLYGRRWQIETFFKSAKSFLRLGKDSQSTNYGALVASTTITFVRYILLEYLKRQQNDPMTMGELFSNMCEHVPDIPFSKAFKYICSLFKAVMEHIKNEKEETTPFVKEIICQVNDWITTLPSFIRHLLPDFSWES